LATKRRLQLLRVGEKNAAFPGNFRLLALAAQPAAAQSSLASQVQNQLAMVVTSNSSDVGIAAIDLSTGETVHVRGTQRYPMASTMKIAVAAAYLSYVERGERSLDEIIGGRSAASLMRTMIVRSDNHATDLLIRNLGGPRTSRNGSNGTMWRVSGSTGPSRSCFVPSATFTRTSIRRPLWPSPLSSSGSTGAISCKPWSRNYLLKLMADTRPAATG
jgi:beta-lactamase class A